jgi:isopenicillin N synthase-like dioxygenase
MQNAREGEQRQVSSIMYNLLDKPDIGISSSQVSILKSYVEIAHDKAVEVAVLLGIPRKFWPHIDSGILRVLEYPPETCNPKHTDYDLFTLMCYRNLPDKFRYVGEQSKEALEIANTLNKQIHFGRLLNTATQGLYEGTPHEVIIDADKRTQYSIVYFANPDPKTVLPNGSTVESWIKNKVKRGGQESY